MTVYSAQIDTVITLPTVQDNVTPVAGVTVNRLRDTAIAIESELGIKPSGTYATVRARLDALEAAIFNENGSGNITVYGIPQPGQTIIWNGAEWSPTPFNPPYSWNNHIENNFLGADIITSGGLSVGPIETVSLQTGLLQLSGKFIVDPITTSIVSNANQGMIYFDAITNQFLISENGSAYMPLTGNTFIAGGDLSGSNTNQTVIAIQGNPVLTQSLGVSQDGYALVWNGSVWQAQSINSSVTLGGDVISPSGASTVVKIQGNPVQALSLGVSQDGYVLQWVNSSTNWAPIQYAGDVTGKPSASTVSKLNGCFVPSGPLTDGYVLQATGTYNLSYAPINLAGNSVIGILPTANQAKQSLTLVGDVTGSGTTTSTTTSVQKINGATVPPAVTAGYVLQVAGANALSYGPVYLNTSSVAGILPTANQAYQQLIGDVDGYTNSNTVIAIQGVSVSSTPPVAGQVLTYLGSTWQSSPITTLQTYPVSAIAPTDGYVLGFVSGTWTPINPSQESTATGPAGGDLDGYYPNPTVIAIQGNLISTNTPTDGYVLTWNELDGYWLPLPQTNMVTGPASGDLDGYYPGPTVIAIQGIAISNTAPTINQVLQYNGVNWAPATPTAIFVAGGDLSGTSTDQTVIAIQGNSISTSLPSDGQVLTWIAANSFWQATTPPTIPITLPPSGPATGDLDGYYPNPTVAALHGNPIAAVGPATGQVLTWDGSNWAPETAASSSFTAGGDLYGTNIFQTVIGLQNNPVESGILGSLQDGYILTWVNADGYWEPKPNITNVRQVTLITGDYTTSASDEILFVDATNSPTITLTTGLSDGTTLTLKDIGGNAETSNIKVEVLGGATIDGDTSYIITVNYSSIDLIYYGGNFYVT